MSLLLCMPWHGWGHSMASDLCPCCGRPRIADTDDAAQKAKLSPSERALFRAIARGQGEDIPMDAIHAAIWGSRSDGGPDGAENVIRRHVSVVRKKVAKFGFGIETAYGVGYRLVALKARAS